MQQLAASYYGFDPESMRVFFFGPFSEAQLTGSFSEVLFGSAIIIASSMHPVVIINVPGEKEPNASSSSNRSPFPKKHNEETRQVWARN